MQGRGGQTLGSFLVFLSVIGVLTLTMGAVSLHHTRYATLASNRQQARTLAESAVAEATARVLESPLQAYGRSRQPGDTITVTFPDYPPGSYGLVTFDKARAASEKLAWSTNNINSGGVEPAGIGPDIAEDVLHLVARGQVAGSTYTIETQVYLPPFPNALASLGPVRSLGGLLVGGVADPAAFPGDYASVPPDKKTAAHVASNSNAAVAVDLGPGARVEGNVMAVGGIRLDTSVSVRGEVKEHAGPQPVPQLDLNALFARIDAQIGKTLIANPVVSGDYDLKWTAKRAGDLRIMGDLVLDGGLLFVAGDLKVDGVLRGHGTVVAGGSIEIQTGTTLSATDQAAIVARGPVRLSGQSQSSYYFQGLVYSEAEVEARKLTVLGSIVARGVSGLRLEDISLVNSPVTLNLIDGLEMINQSDDDTDMLLIRVEQRDPHTRRPISYHVQLRGVKDGVTAGPAVETSGLRTYQEIKDWINSVEPAASQGYADHSFHHSWFWDPQGEENGYTSNPLQAYLDALSGKSPDPQKRFSLNFDPNQALGVVERARVLLWREI